MSAGKTVREVQRVYRRLVEHTIVHEPLFGDAREAVVDRLCAPIAQAFNSEPPIVEGWLMEHSGAPIFTAALLDEFLLWRAPDGSRLLDRLIADRQLRKRPLARQFLERLDASTLRLWDADKVSNTSFASVHRSGRDDPPRRVELFDDLKPLHVGDRIVARRLRVGTVRVFADGWLAFPSETLAVLRGLEGSALMDRAFCLWALLALGDQAVLDGWLRSLEAHDSARRDERAGRDERPERDNGTDSGADHAHRGSGGGAGAPSRRRGGSDPERERLLERIRKLFAMAQETEASPHEAEIALRRCQSLMARFGITEAELETSEFGVASVASGRTVTTHAKLLGGAVALLHDVIFVVGPEGMAEFRGYDLDVRVATLTLGYLRNAMERALSARKRRGELPPGRSAAFDYRVAFANEVHARVLQLVAERRVNELAEAGDGRALAVRKREQVDREFGGDLVSKRLSVRGPRDAEAAGAGRADGGEVSLDPQLG